MSYILQTECLTKTINGKELVADVNMHVKKGQIYGFLGPNGAGKTTVMKMLTNLWKPTSGAVHLFGQKLTPHSYDFLKRMGCILEFPVFYGHLSGYENLALHCEYMGYHHPDCIKNALELLDLSAAAHKPVQSYSLGMKQRLGIARAILSKPELLILDEPTNGLDPAGMKQIRNLLKTLCAEYGITIVISSHILAEIESIADTIGIIHHGKLTKEVSMAEISEKNRAYVELSVPDAKRASYILSEKAHLENFRILDGQNIRIYDPDAAPQTLSKILTQNQIEILAIGRHCESLEDYFLELTSEERGPQ